MDFTPKFNRVSSLVKACPLHFVKKEKENAMASIFFTHDNNFRLQCQAKLHCGEKKKLHLRCQEMQDLLPKLQTDTAGVSVAIPHAALLSF